MASKEINVFELEKPKSFCDLLAQSEIIVKDIGKWLIKLKVTISFAQKHRELISENETKDALHNISQNIMELSQLIQDKIWRD